MFQNLDGKTVFVVDFTERPVPFRVQAVDTPYLQPYADALNQAIARGLVRESGKYGIEVNFRLLEGLTWNIYAIKE